VVGLDPLDRGRHRRLVGDVEGERAAAGGLEVGDRLGAPRGRVHRPALRCEVLRGRAADAARAAGDQDGTGVLIGHAENL
jgi:hypothetical protein